MPVRVRFVAMDSELASLVRENHRVDEVGGFGVGRWLRRWTLPSVVVAALFLGAACSGDETETTDISSTTGVPGTDAAPDAAPDTEPTTTTSLPPLRVNLVQVFGGSVSTDPPPIPEFSGDRTDVDKSEMAAVAVGGPGLVAGGSSHSVEAEGIDAAVWVSPDGRSWQRIDDDAGVFGDAMSVTGVGGDQFISGIAGGSLGVVAVGGDGVVLAHDAAVWVSSDGLVWERVRHDANVFGGEGEQLMHAVVQSAGTAVVVGESAGEATVWVSTDGRQWTRAVVDDDSARAATEPSVIRDVTVVGDGMVAVGSAGLDLRPAVWISADGLTWSRVLDSMAGPESGFDTELRPMTAVAGNEHGIVAIGTQLRPDENLEYWDPATNWPLAWVSVDGVEWDLLDASFVELTAEQDSSRYAYLKRAAPVMFEDVTWEDDRMMAIGGYELAPSGQPSPSFVTLWASIDGGVTWQIAAESTQPPAYCECGARRLAEFGDSAVLVGLDAISAGKHPHGWEVWADTPAVWIADLPAQ